MAVEVTGIVTINTTSNSGLQSVTAPPYTEGSIVFVGGFSSGADSYFEYPNCTVQFGAYQEHYMLDRNTGNSLENDVCCGFKYNVPPPGTIDFSWSFNSAITSGYMICIVFTKGTLSSTVGVASSNTGDVSSYDITCSTASATYGSRVFCAVVSNTSPTINTNNQTELAIIGPDAKSSSKYMGVFMSEHVPNGVSQHVYASSLSFPGLAGVAIHAANTIPASWLRA